MDLFDMLEEPEVVDEGPMIGMLVHPKKQTLGFLFGSGKVEKGKVNWIQLREDGLYLAGVTFEKIAGGQGGHQTWILKQEEGCFVPVRCDMYVEVKPKLKKVR